MKQIKVIPIQQNPSFDSWRGAVKFANECSEISQFMISRKEYLEYGSEYFKEH